MQNIDRPHESGPGAAEWLEQPLTLRCHGEQLCAILHGSKSPSRRGLLIVVGGPNYRVGSHRQFVLLARRLAAADIPVMRFDYRGMGDSEGDQRSFEAIAEDIRCALNLFFDRVPGMAEVALFGLCDGASAALFYAEADPRVTGLILVNPWVHTEEGEARAYLKHYYRSRLRSRDLWKRVGSGAINWRDSAMSIFAFLRRAAGAATVGGNRQKASLPVRMERSWARFRGKILLILSGADLTASEFRDAVQASKRWRCTLSAPNVATYAVAEANHTLSRQSWREPVFDRIEEWLRY